MTAKEYLSQAWNIDRRINDKVAHVSQLRDMAMNVSAVISDMPRSPSPNNQRMENIIARLTDTEDKIHAKALDEVEKILEKRQQSSSEFT